MSNFKWTEDATNKLLEVVNGETPVSADTVNSAAETLGTSVRSVAAKLRKLGHEVVSMAKPRESKFDPADTEALKSFVEANPGRYTYAELSAQFKDGAYEPKVVQGKILSLQLTTLIRKTEKVEVPRTYTPDQEATFISLVNAGKFVEEIAAALSKEVNSVRGKALSLLRAGTIAALPKQRDHVAEKVDPVDAMLDKIPGMTVAEIAEELDKTERGIKTMLTRRGLVAKDYDGAAKKAKKGE